ncbi:MAG: TetR/AcrR family transcriptional regulator [Alphaproteobacteria bacterium]|nr:TetR/AcrR family transcriptional regulator [Alphaproteobacteria bacterium]
MASKGEITREKILETAEALVLEQGFSGTSIDDIIGGAGLTKGAFFYHFNDKGALARALAHRYWEEDFRRLDDFAARARSLADDPLQAVFLFFKLFEEFIESLEEVPIGCLFASYVYESRQFDPALNDFIETGFRNWGRMMEGLFDDAIAAHPPNAPVTAAELAEISMSIIEGGFILARAYKEAPFLARQSRIFRQLLESLFAEKT